MTPLALSLSLVAAFAAGIGVTLYTCAALDRGSRRVAEQACLARDVARKAAAEWQALAEERERTLAQVRIDSAWSRKTGRAAC